MTLSALNPALVSPGLVPTANTQTGVVSAQPMLLPNAQLNPAALGVVENQKPGIITRFSNAMQAALGELRGSPTSAQNISPQSAQLALQSPAALAPEAAPAQAQKATSTKKTAAKKNAAKKSTAKKSTAKKAADTAKPKTESKPKAAEAVATGGVLGAAAAAATSAANPAAQLPSNATVLPGATVYSYADAQNPGLAGLQGLSPQMQAQLGIMPSNYAAGMQQLGMTADGSIAPPQQNITNQTDLSAGNNVGGLGLNGILGYGTAPTVGAPISGNMNLSEATQAKIQEQQAAQRAERDAAKAAEQGAPAPPNSAALPSVQTAGANSAVPVEGQSVVNRNRFDSQNLNNDPYGSLGWGNGIASPMSPYGASMNGTGFDVQPSNGGILGWFSRLLS